MASNVQLAWKNFLPLCAEEGELEKAEQYRIFAILENKVRFLPATLAKDENDWNTTLEDIGITGQARTQIKIGLRKLQDEDHKRKEKGKGHDTAPSPSVVHANNNNAANQDYLDGKVDFQYNISDYTPIQENLEFVKLVLGELYLKPLPLSTRFLKGKLEGAATTYLTDPIRSLDLLLHPFDFLYLKDPMVVGDNAQKFKEMVVDKDARVRGEKPEIVCLALSGAGKTFSCYHLATTDNSPVFLVVINIKSNWGGITGIIKEAESVLHSRIQEITRETAVAEHRARLLEVAYKNFETEATNVCMRALCAALYCLRKLVQDNPTLTPEQFLRYQENGAMNDLLIVSDALKGVKLFELATRCISDIMKYSGKKVLIMWDESQLLTQIGSNCVMYQGAVAATTIKLELGTLENGTSAIAVVARIGEVMLAHTLTLIAGTTLHLQDIKDKTSQFLKNLVHVFSDYPLWTADDVKSFLSGVINLSALSDDTITSVCFALVGRARIAVTYVGVLYVVRKEEVSLNCNEAALRALDFLSAALRIEYRDCVDLFIRTQQVDRLKVLQDIVVGRAVVLDQNQHDLVSAGIMNLTSKYEAGKIEYKGAEPAMITTIKEVLVERNMLPDAHMDDYAHVKTLPKGPYAESIFREVLVNIAQLLMGQAITNHPVFAVFKSTILSHYTLEAAESLEDTDGSLWESVVRNQLTNVVVKPPALMRPDVLVFLRKITLEPNLPPYIPCTGSSKNIFKSTGSSVEADSLDSMDFSLCWTKQRSQQNADQLKETAQQVETRMKLFQLGGDRLRFPTNQEQRKKFLSMISNRDISYGLRIAFEWSGDGGLLQPSHLTLDNKIFFLRISHETLHLPISEYARKCLEYQRTHKQMN